jgi:hypothetical protein
MAWRSASTVSVVMGTNADLGSIRGNLMSRQGDVGMIRSLTAARIMIARIV